MFRLSEELHALRQCLLAWHPLPTAYTPKVQKGFSQLMSICHAFESSCSQQKLGHQLLVVQPRMRTAQQALPDQPLVTTALPSFCAMPSTPARRSSGFLLFQPALLGPPPAPNPAAWQRLCAQLSQLQRFPGWHFAPPAPQLPPLCKHKTILHKRPPHQIFPPKKDVAELPFKARWQLDAGHVSTACICHRVESIGGKQAWTLMFTMQQQTERRYRRYSVSSSKCALLGSSLHLQILKSALFATASC